MPSFGHDEVVAVVNVRLRVVGNRRRLGKRGNDVQRGQGPCRVLDSRSFGGHARAEVLVYLDLALEDALVGAEHLLLVLLERGRREALASGNRLLAVVVGRRRMEVCLRNLDVVSEHAVDPDFERADAGPRALAFLHLGNHLTAGTADPAQLVELRVDAVTRKAAVASEGGRLVDERSVDQVPYVEQLVELGEEAAEEGRADLLEDHFHARHRSQRLFERHEVPWTGGPECRPCDQTLEGLYGLQPVAGPPAVRRSKRE